MLEYIRSSLIEDHVCDLQSILKVIAVLQKELSEDYVICIVLFNEPLLPISKSDPRKKIVIMLSDEVGITPCWLDDADIIFRTLSSNSCCDYKKIFPIPTGYFAPLLGHSYEGELPKKSLADRDSDIFYSGKATKGERLFFYKRAHRLTKKFSGIINGTTGWMQGETYMDTDTYYAHLNNCRIAFAPKAYVTPETIRYIEAFESGCITITDHPIHQQNHNLWYYEGSPAIFLKSWWQLNPRMISKLLAPDSVDEYQEKNITYYNSKLSSRAVAQYILDRIDEMKI